MKRYLFTYFSGEEEPGGEQVYFAVSRDGLHWEEINEGRPVLHSEEGTGGVRDPFPVRDPRSGRCYLIATDLKIEGGGSWQDAKRFGSRRMLVWKSDDLVKWTGPGLYDVAPEDAGCLWAPEAIFDKEKNGFFVYFASWTGDRDNGIGKQRIYLSFTSDFEKFSKPVLYIERKDDVIDTTIVKAGERFYRISKNETSKKLILEAGDSLQGSYSPVYSEILEKIEGVEGPECYCLPDGKWCVIADCYSRRRGYFPMITENLEGGKFVLPGPDEYCMGENRKRHGGVMEITSEEYERLCGWRND
ncbi:MAG TPA: glycoside hydrolase family 43 protein [Candidatus Mediterraneibacter norfolkensis]|nr:glycoside hydrolase family 43 protein [Candidatus Mediterraneibacter norfolkensis]